MTGTNPVKPRHPYSWAGAITRIRGHLGLAASEAVGLSESILAKWGDPDRRESPSIGDALALDRAYVLAGGPGDAPLLAVYLKLLQEATGGAVHKALAPEARMLAVVAEIGELSADLHRSLGDGQLAEHERLRLLKDVADACEKLSAMAKDLDALAPASAGGSGKTGGAA